MRDCAAMEWCRFAKYAANPDHPAEHVLLLLLPLVTQSLASAHPQCGVDMSPVQQQLLQCDVIHHEGPSQRRVCLRLGKWEAIAVPAQQSITMRPLCHWCAQYELHRGRGVSW